VTEDQGGSSTEPVGLTAWFSLADLPAGLAFAVIAVLFPVSWAAAYWLGGGTNVLPEWFLIPILLAGLCSRRTPPRARRRRPATG
jgi:hypothetical protein